ncbi:tRNA 2-thiouridine(34) synthase MnmA [Collinsella sp. zg1085]|nr:tRNA 2-thiouridine(34) synthase MnmA [Collinsella sp. zg1085]
MSGGVDSSVTAYVLQQEGYECVGATMRLTCSRSFGDEGGRTCCSLADIADAEAVCARLGIPYHVLDMRDIFERTVIDKFVHSYQQGYTPNPCIDCNRFLKFGALAEYALEHDFDAIATGHYAQIQSIAPNTELNAYPLLNSIQTRINNESFWTLRRALDSTKDQSYVLYALTQHALAHTLLPLGSLIKERDVRRIAAEQGFINAEKQDSQGICFVPDGNYAHYIEEHTGKALQPGDILNTQGEVIGQHLGALNYTIGQRKGLGVAMLHPVYVVDIDAKANTVTLGEESDLMSSGLLADDWIWSVPAHAIHELLDEDYNAHAEGLPVLARIRYHQEPQPARLLWDTETELPHRRVRINFDTDQRAIAPGQAVVVYAGDVVLGGGTAIQAFPRHNA